MKNKKKIVIVLAGILILNPILALADTVTGIQFSNNLNRDSDYKISGEESKKTSDRLKVSSTTKEIFDDNEGRTIGENNRILSYLIENNILSRENTIAVSNNGFTVDNSHVLYGPYMNKTDFLMGVYKSIYGPISSRPLDIIKPSERDGDQVLFTDKPPKGYTGSDKSFQYEEGDHFIYMSPNVRELYLSELINKSVIETADLLPQYQDGLLNKAEHEWDSSAPAHNPLMEGGKAVLGDSYNVQNGGSYVNYSQAPVNYFMNEEIQTLDALKLVEMILRLNEKDLTNTEAEIVAYKYGTSYLLNFPDDVRKTLTYLIAMGVLDFENPGEFGNIYDSLTNEFAYTLMYRLHNKSGRKDFDKIQLTDSENQLMKQGFIEDRLRNTENFEGVMPETEDVTVPQEGGPVVEMTSITNKLFNMMGFEREDRGIVYAAGNSGYKDFEVTKLFIDTDNTRYKGTRIREVSKDKFKEIKEITPKEKGAIQITFVVRTPTEAQAVASIDSRVTITGQSMEEKGSVNTITQVVAGKFKVSYISSRELGNKVSEISIVNSKTLKNKVTGDSAMLLADHKLALVGNTVIRSEAAMVTRINGIEYYNMDMVVPLMTNAYISKIDPLQLYTKVKLPPEQIVKVKGTGNGETIEHVPVVLLGKGTTNGDVLISEKDKKYFYNINLVTRGVSTLMREFIVKEGGKTVKAKVIVDWSYSIPKTGPDGKKIEDPKILKMTQKGKEFTIKEASDYLYTRPSEPYMRDWWDNNIHLSNGLANLMYGTSEEPQNYVSSGYMAPSVTVLADNSSLSNEALMRHIFGKMGLPQSYVTKYLKGDIRNFHDILFNKTGTGLDSRRTFHIYKGTTTDKEHGIVSYSDNFVSYPTGAVYKRVFGDPRIEFITTKSDKHMEVNTRAKETMQRIDPQYVKYTGQDGVNHVLYFSGYTGEKRTGNYLRLTTKTPLAGKPMKIKDKGGKETDDWTLRNSNNEDAYERLLTNMRKVIPDSMIRQDIPNNQKFIEPPANIYSKANSLTKTGYVERGKLKAIKKSGSKYEKKIIESSDKNAFGHPAIFLRRSDFKFKPIKDTGDGIKYKLVMERTNPFLEVGNVFYSGLNSSLISRLLEKDSSCVPLSKLPGDAKVIIQDKMWYKTGSTLTSEPIGGNTVKNVKTGVESGQDAVRKEILKYFQGMSISYSGRETDRTNGQVAFSSYVEHADLGGIDHLRDDQLNGVMFKQRQAVKLSRGKGDIKNLTPIDTPNSVVLELATDEYILYRLIDKRNKVYEILTVSDKYAEGYLDNVDMFYETLDLTGQDDIFLSLKGNKFNLLEKHDTYVNNILYDYHKALQGDGVTVIKQFLVVIISLLIIMSWMAYAILKFNLGKSFLFTLRETFETDTSNGLDIVKIITLGVLSLDSELKSSAFFVGNLGMFGLLYILLSSQL